MMTVLLAAGLAACGATGRDQPILQRVHEMDRELPPSRKAFLHCSGYGCVDRMKVTLGPGDWASIAAIFEPVPETPADERARLGQAVARFERIAGAQTGTDRDLGGTYSNMFATGQLDCADETVNVGTYLRILDDEGLIRHHRIGGRVHRGNFFDRLPHMSPYVVDLQTGESWVIDSWYRDHGDPPEIVTVETWRNEPYEAWGATGESARP